MLSMNELYFPAKDRSFWYSDSPQFPLRYLAWGTRNFHRQPIPITRHSGWVVALIEQGSPLLASESSLIQTSPGSLVIIPAGDRSGWRMDDDRDCKFLLWMWNAALPSIPDDRKTHIKLSKKERQAFKQHHELCRQEVLALDVWSQLHLEGAFGMFCSITARAHKAPQSTTDNQSKVIAAASWLLENINSQQPVARLCDYLNISQSSLYRLFKEHYAMSPKQYIHITKMELAKKMILDRNLSVKETSLSLGYNHSNDFSRAFRQHFGTSCADLKKAHAAANQAL